MHSFEIRKAVPADFEHIYALIKAFAAFQKTPEKVVITLAEMVEHRDWFNCYIALDKETIIGFATYFFAYYSWSGKAVYLDDLYVVELYRQRGIGRMLLNKIIETAKENNCKKIRWQVSNWNIKAIGFYKRLGVVIDDVEINCDFILH